MSDYEKNSITLPVPVALGTGVMIGAGVVVNLLVAFAVGSSLPAPIHDEPDHLPLGPQVEPSETSILADRRQWRPDLPRVSHVWPAGSARSGGWRHRLALNKASVTAGGLAADEGKGAARSGKPADQEQCPSGQDLPASPAGRVTTSQGRIAQQADLAGRPMFSRPPLTAEPIKFILASPSLLELIFSTPA